MANSKIYLGSTNIGNLYEGDTNVSIYLGENKVYPLAEPSIKWKATYSDSSVTSAECDSSSEIVNGDINKTSLVSVEIGDCVTSIGGNVFYYCSSLTSIDIPSGVTSIGSMAFQGCSSLTSITIGSGVTTIGNQAFYGCSSLTSITVNATTPPTLGSGAFNSTNNCPIYVPCESVNAYKSASGWSTYASRITCLNPPFQGKWKATYSDSHTESAQCDSSSAITEDEINLTNLVSVEIGDCVTSIDDSAFQFCNSLTSIVIPDSVTSIGINAFAYCSSLTSITVNATTPPTLDGGAFISSTCPIYVPCESVNAYKSASGWSTYASRITCIEPPFQGKWKATYQDSHVESAQCDSSSAIVIGDINKTNLVSAEIGDCVTSISGSVFSSCSGLTSIVMPDSVTGIGNNVFSLCYNLKRVNSNTDGVFNIPSGVTSIEQNLFSRCYYLTTINIPSGVTTIGQSAFNACSGLTIINIPSDVTSIGEQAFYDCRGLTSVNIPSGVTRIERSTFKNCISLTNIEIPNSVTSIGNDAFSDCRGLTSIEIPSGVTSIGDSAFTRDYSLTAVTINATTPPTLGNGAFDNTNNCPIYVSCESVNAYKSASGWSTYASRITCLNPPTYKYGVDIQGLEGKDTCDIDWKNIKTDYGVGNGSYTITTTADTVDVTITNYDTSSYSVDYDYFTLTSNNPSKTVTFTYQGGGNLQYIPQGTDMTQYYNRPITRFKIGDSSLPSGYQSVNIAFTTGGQSTIDAWGGVNLNFGGTRVTSLPCDVSGFDEFNSWLAFNPSWQSTNENPFTDLWIEFA